MTYEERKLLDLHQEVEDVKTYIKHYTLIEKESQKLEYYTHVLQYLQEKYGRFLILQKGINS